MNKFDDFDPNEKPTKQPWGTFIPGFHNRRKEFKTHTELQFAKRAIKYHGFGKIYELVNDEWVERLSIEPASPSERVCDKCGKPKYVRKGNPDAQSYNLRYDKNMTVSYFVWDKDSDYGYKIYHYDCKPAGMY